MSGAIQCQESWARSRASACTSTAAVREAQPLCSARILETLSQRGRCFSRMWRSSRGCVLTTVQGWDEARSGPEHGKPGTSQPNWRTCISRPRFLGLIFGRSFIQGLQPDSFPITPSGTGCGHRAGRFFPSGSRQQTAGHNLRAICHDHALEGVWRPFGLRRPMG